MPVDLPTSGEARTFGVLLARYRKDADLSQSELASRAGLSRFGISKLERGAALTPHNGNLERIVVALKLTLKQTELLREAASLKISPAISFDDTIWTPEHGALLLHLPLKVFLRLFKRNRSLFPAPITPDAPLLYLRWERYAWIDRFGQITPHVETRSIARAATAARLEERSAPARLRKKR